jgi:hypothetical protein
MTTEAADTAALLALARTSLERYLDVQDDRDGALVFTHADVPCVIQATQLAEGLTVLSLTCVVAWDLPSTKELAAIVAERAGDGLFGTLGLVRTDHGADVTLRYAFPAQGMRPAPLGTLLMLVISTASRLRVELFSDEFDAGSRTSEIKPE